MVVYNYSGKEINAKIVYYGPALSGKTTNLEWIYSKIPTEYSGKMVSLRTQADRTIFFDFLPLELGLIDGFKTRFMLYTVPGQVYYNATRKMVLKGVDGIVFVADSETGRMADNIESFENLKENLQELGIDPSTVPLCLQWNKRDLPNCDDVALLDEKVNEFGSPTFEACAPTGQGVYETLHRICRMVYQKLTMGDHAVPADPSSPAGDGESLFGTTIAHSLQEIDYPTAEPERVALGPDDPEETMPDDDRPVLQTILGNSAPVPPASAPVPPAPEATEEDGLVSDLVDEVLGRLDEQPVSTGAVPTPPAAASAPIAPAQSAPQAPAQSAPQIPAQSAPQIPAQSAPQAPAQSAAQPPVQSASHAPVTPSRPVPPASAAFDSAPREPVPAGGPLSGGQQVQPTAGTQSVHPDPMLAGDELGALDLDPEAPLIEHDVDPFEKGPGEHDAMAGDEDLGLITDPLKRSEDSVSDDSSRAFVARATDAKVIEVPITLDADAISDGKTIRVVLNLQVRR